MELYVFWPLLGLLLVADWIGSRAAGLCQCGKRKRFILSRNHVRLPGLLTTAVLVSVMLLSLVLFRDWGAVIWGLLTLASWLAVYYHEKDKIKRAAQALGRVVVTGSGRLAVE